MNYYKKLKKLGVPSQKARKLAKIDERIDKMSEEEAALAIRLIDTISAFDEFSSKLIKKEGVAERTWPITILKDYFHEEKEKVAAVIIKISTQKLEVVCMLEETEEKYVLGFKIC